VSLLLPSPRPDGARALGAPAGSGRGQTLPGAAHPAPELPGEALLQLAAGAVVSLPSPGTAPSRAPPRARRGRGRRRNPSLDGRMDWGCRSRVGGVSGTIGGAGKVHGKAGEVQER